MIRRRSIEVFSLSFLDCLCCGFGAILLLFLLSLSRQSSPKASNENTLSELRTELFELEQSLIAKTQQLEQQEASQAITSEFEKIQNSLQPLKSKLQRLENQLQTSLDALDQYEREQEEQQRILKTFNATPITPIGLPNDATHLAFIIDTSGSMRHPFTQQLHAAVLQEIQALLKQLGKVEKIQFLDSSGRYLLQSTRGQWIDNQRSAQQQAMRALQDYPFASVSDPSRGIRKSIQDLLPKLDEQKVMSLFVLGDDFRGSTQALLRSLDRANPILRSSQQRAASISAIGFPTRTSPFTIASPVGNTRFANVMREVVREHNGVLILGPSL
ncbi:MAG: hypothetical protein ACPGF8_02335 [Opitutales bacterium]